MTVEPATTEAEAGLTVTVVTTGAGGGVEVTVIAAVPEIPELTAVMVADPVETPVTTPLELTDAAPLLLDHETACPVMTFPF